MTRRRNEADTRAELIDPRLKAAGWTDGQVTREHYYRRDYDYTAGHIRLRGDRAQHDEPRQVDYLLRYTDAFPIAVVEAKAETKSAHSGFEQAKEYARDLGLAFAYATNGRDIIEYDGFTRQSSELAEFPRPADLWERWRINTGLTEIPAGSLREASVPYALDRFRNPLLYPYAPRALTGKAPRYFQEAAILEVVRRLVRGQKRALLTMATGAGKTFVAFQIVWKLVKSGWLNRLHQDRPGRILFLADRIALRDQAYNQFSAFNDGTSDPRSVIKDGKANLSNDLYFAIYQSLWGDDPKGVRLFEKFPANFFDLVIIDEAHRSGFGTWREILDRFGDAIHLGMTATPKQTENVDTYTYFCSEEPEVAIDATDPAKGCWKPPAYTYSLGQGIEDGFLATYKGPPGTYDD